MAAARTCACTDLASVLVQEKGGPRRQHVTNESREAISIGVRMVMVWEGAVLLEAEAG